SGRENIFRCLIRMADIPDLSPEQRALFMLSLVPNLGPRLTRALVERFGSAEAVLRAEARELNEVPRLREELAGEVGQILAAIDGPRELELLRQHRVRLVFEGEAESPPALIKIHDPPPVLYVRGAIEPADAKAVALVGSRNCT